MNNESVIRLRLARRAVSVPGLTTETKGALVVVMWTDADMLAFYRAMYPRMNWTLDLVIMVHIMVEDELRAKGREGDVLVATARAYRALTGVKYFDAGGSSWA